MKKTIIIEQMGLVVLAAVAAGCAIMFLRAPSVVGGAVTGFVAALSAFLLVDLVKTVYRTSLAPTGEFEPLQKGRYYFGLVLVGILFALTLVRASEGLLFEAAQGALITAFMVIIGEIITAVQANKIATAKGPAV